jgi:phosphate starvation-inducible PhoH-like protein
LKKRASSIHFGDNSLLPQLFGEHDSHLLKIEEKLKITMSARGNVVSISGDGTHVDNAERILESLYKKLEKGMEITMSDVEAAIRMVAPDIHEEKHGDQTTALFDEQIVIQTLKKLVTPYSNHQKKYIKELFKKDMIFAVGPAGTGKTYLAVAVAVSMFLDHRFERIVLVRPAVEAGEKIGFLPGDMKDKVDPYMQPLYDALYDMMPGEKVAKHIENRIIEIAPLAFMRGRTLKNAFIILDEAQNATPTQMKMFLTRMGEGSKMAITGDTTQIDLPPNVPSGLADAVKKLADIPEIGFITFEKTDIVRHSLVSKIVNAYDEKK